MPASQDGNLLHRMQDDTADLAMEVSELAAGLESLVARIVDARLAAHGLIPPPLTEAEQWRRRLRGCKPLLVVSNEEPPSPPAKLSAGPDVPA
jgi:hypothetical protein